MPRSIWKGTLGFGLVQIPVGLYPAEEANELSFTLLDRRDLSPIGYERVNKTTGKKVEWSDVVKGYEVADDEYIVLSDQDFAAANVEATQSVDIVDFVDASEIDLLLFERPYYLVPTKAGRKAYALLRETLKRAKRIGIAKVVIRTRQHLAAVMPHDGVLALMLLRFPDEMRDTKRLDIPDQSVKKLGITDKELKMAAELVNGMADDFEPKRYHDEYREDLLKLIEKKAEAGDVNKLPDGKKKAPPKRAGAQVIDLMDLLKQSVGKAKGAPRKARARHTRSHSKKSA